jgi:NhaP-type Na+/H+ or K+/H+ antiporter
VAMKVHDSLVGDTTESGVVRASRGALIGAGIGAAAGLVTAVIATHRSGVTDHSEDALAYVYFPAFGAFLGLVIGAVVGLVRH